MGNGAYVKEEEYELKKHKEEVDFNPSIRFPNLQKLNLSNNCICDINPLSNLRKIEIKNINLDKEKEKSLNQYQLYEKDRKLLDSSYNKKIKEYKLIKITINNNQQKININYNPDLTIISIKNEIIEIYGYPIESQEIFLNNILLNDNDKISDLELKYNIFLIDQLTLSLKDRTIKFNYKNENFEIKISL